MNARGRRPTKIDLSEVLRLLVCARSQKSFCVASRVPHRIRVGQTKGASSWDIDPHITELRDKLAEMLPGLTLTIVAIRAEGQADLFPLGDYTVSKISPF
jgi:hypothetical protein